MTQRKYLFLGLTAVLALAITTLFVARELTVTDARTADATMQLTVSAGGACAAGTCTVALNAAFTMQVNTAAPPSPEGYIGIQTEIDYHELVAHGGVYNPGVLADEITWTNSAFPLRSPGTPTGMEGLINHADATGVTPPFPVSHATGSLLELAFHCGPANSTNAITLVPIGATPPAGAPAGYGGTNAAGFKGGVAPFTNITAKTTSITLVCGSVTPPTPTVPPPTNTPIGPTNTPGPTATPAPPTSTPTITNTPGPTNTPAPTHTPGPTNTPRPATPTPTGGCGMAGDTNGDGILNAVDSLWILWDVANLSDFVPCPAAEDVDHNGHVTPVDSALILQFIAHLINHLP